MAFTSGVLLGALGSIAAPGMPAQSQSLCQYNFGNSTFDLSGLTVPAFYAVRDSRNNPGSTNYTYFFNVCANVNYLYYPECAATVPGAGNPFPVVNASSPAFQYANFPVPTGDKCHRLGGSVSPSTMAWGLYDQTNPSKGVWLQYTGGDRCPLTNLYRSLKVWLQCYNDATNIPDDEVVLESTCMYEIFLKTTAGCPVQCPVGMSNGKRALCSNHGVCDYDAALGNSRCFCNPGFAGDDCSDTPSAKPAGLSAVGGVLVGVSIFLALVLGFLAYLWFFKIARLRLDPAAYSALRGGPTSEDLGGISGGSKLSGLPPAAPEGRLN